jgi:HD-GYP domain-containing protein (c-di-GMP phosphodiesterase class II)
VPFPDARRRGLAESFLPPLPARPSRAAALVAAMQLKDPYTRGHGDRVGEAAALIGAELRLPADALRDLRLAGTLHDIGKLAVPGCLLRKPGPLTPAERETVQRHPRHGYALVCGSEVPAVARVAVLHHHERLDGGGYPHGLAGRRIPWPARIVSVADALDAMTSTRSYRPARPVAAALAELRRCAGSQFDPAVVSALARALARHPWPPPALPGTPAAAATPAAPVSAPAAHGGASCRM